MYTTTNQRGAALVSVLFFLIIITILAAGTIMVATTQVNVSGSMARWELGLTSAESGADFVMPSIYWMLYDGVIPSRYASFINDPNIVNEISDPVAHFDIDTFSAMPVSGYPVPGPDFSFNFPFPVDPTRPGNAFRVDVDVDSMGMISPPGANQVMTYEFAWGYHGGVGGGGAANRLNTGLVVGYRIHSRATLPAIGKSATQAEIIQIMGVPPQ